MNVKKQQQGFSLFLVMVLMLVIAMLVIVTNQSSLTEMRLSSNEADRKVALSRAEEGLRAAENDIRDIVEAATPTDFTDACINGLCQPARDSFNSLTAETPFAFDGAPNSEIEAWYRCSANTAQNCREQAGRTVLDSNATSRQASDNRARYIIEYLGMDSSDKEIFRITAKAVGDNENTNVLLQSYVELTR